MKFPIVLRNRIFKRNLLLFYETFNNTKLPNMLHEISAYISDSLFQKTITFFLHEI